MSSTEPSAASPEEREIAVVICVYTEKRWDDIVEAVESVENQSYAAGQVVVVVDHNDNLLAKAREHFGDSVTIVANKHQRGLSGARNSGIEASSAPIIAFLDDDAVAERDWLQELTGHYTDENVMGTGGSVNPIWATARPNWWPREFDWVVGCSYAGLPTGTATIRNPIGANMSVRRSAFLRVGGFSSAIGRVGTRPVGCEETELFIRVRQQFPDASVLYEPSATVGHKVPATRARVSYFLSRCFAEGLSKAVVAKLVGAGDGLSTERSYTMKTLPAGVIRGVRDAIKGDAGGLGRAAAIIAGLFVTAVGYARGSLARGPVRSLAEIPQTSE